MSTSTWSCWCEQLGSSQETPVPFDFAKHFGAIAATPGQVAAAFVEQTLYASTIDSEYEEGPELYYVFVSFTGAETRLWRVAVEVKQVPKCTALDCWADPEFSP
ncbi:hypothetical protein KW797_00105 [Candidatus Parcubacteria bacterium]|nr:hypothetical protein [Candidatus Parcubacteria bacterium]